jgi:TRAP-type C4-dicarboxylate transport system permease large subunit
MAGGIDSFPLLAVPFFILAGNLMNSAGITNRIYDFAVALAGWTRGGLAHVNIIGSVIFSGMSGTAIADAAGLGTIEITAMPERTTMAILPWLVPLFLALAAITYIPELTLFLPKYMGLVK